MIFIVLAIQKLPNFLGYVASLRKLKTLPAFWTLLLLLTMGLVRYLILLALSKNLMTVLLTLFFILSCIFKFLIVGIVNYHQFNSLRQPVLVKITFIVILVQCVIDFFLAIMQLAFFADDFNKLKIGKSTNFRVVTNLLRKSAECSFHYKTLDFFWEKLFNYNNNILQKKYHVLSNEGVNEEVNLQPTNGQDFN